MFLFATSIPNSFRDTSCNLKNMSNVNSKNEVMSIIDDESEFDDEYTYQVGYDVGYDKAKVESLFMIAHLTLFCISLFILRMKI